MVKDVHEHPEHLAKYRKKYKNVYPFSDGIFKMLMANEAKPRRTVKHISVGVFTVISYSSFCKHREKCPSSCGRRK